VAYVRTVKTASGARAVQIVHSSRRGSRDIEHIGSAHDDAALEALKAVARQRLAVGQPELDFGPDFAALQAGSGAGGGPLAITSSRMLPTIRAFMDAHQLADVTVVADAGTISAANQQAIEAAGLSFILGARIPGSSSSPAPPRVSTGPWKPRHAPLPASKATSPTSRTSPPSS